MCFFHKIRNARYRPNIFFRNGRTVLALYQKYQESGPGFADSYLDLLRSGGKDWPHVLVGQLGVDLRDPSFWAGGVAAIGALVDEAEALANA